MSTLAAILLFTLLSGVLSALLAAVFLWLPQGRRDRAMPQMVSFATGTLLATALLALVPHAMSGAGPFKVHEVGVALLAGIALFFLLEKFLLWRHCHTEAVEDAHTHEHHRREASGWLTMVGDGPAAASLDSAVAVGGSSPSSSAQTPRGGSGGGGGDGGRGGGGAKGAAALAGLLGRLGRG